MTSLDSRSRWLALLIVCLGDLMIVLDVTIVGVALPSIREDLGLLGDVARLGRERLPADVRRLPVARRPARRPVRPSAAVHRRHRPVHGRVARMRARDLAGGADRRAGGAGTRRRRRVRRRALADRDAVHRARRACEGDGRVRLRRRGRRIDRRPPRRGHHGRAHLALDLPRERPDRDRGGRLLASRASGRPRVSPRTRASTSAARSR